MIRRRRRKSVEIEARKRRLDESVVEGKGTEKRIQATAQLHSFTHASSILLVDCSAAKWPSPVIFQHLF